jgi:hypothetical protein
MLHMLAQQVNYKLNNGNTLIRDLHYHEMVLHGYSKKQDLHNP